MCCSVLQCVAVCCSVLQCAAVCCSVLQCVAACCSVLQCVAAVNTNMHSLKSYHMKELLFRALLSEYIGLFCHLTRVESLLSRLNIVSCERDTV